MRYFPLYSFVDRVKMCLSARQSDNKKTITKCQTWWYQRFLHWGKSCLELEHRNSGMDARACGWKLSSSSQNYLFILGASASTECAGGFKPQELVSSSNSIGRSKSRDSAWNSLLSPSLLLLDTWDSLLQLIEYKLRLFTSYSIVSAPVFDSPFQAVKFTRSNITHYDLKWPAVVENSTGKWKIILVFRIK